MIVDTRALINSYQQIAHPEERAKELKRIANDLLKMDRDAAIGFFEDGVMYALREDDKQMLGDFYNELGKVYASMDLNTSLEYFFKSLEARKSSGDKVGIAIALNNIGNISNRLGSLDDARNYYQQSLTIFEEEGYQQGLAMSYNNLGNVLGRQGKFADAIPNYKTSLKLKSELGDLRGQGTTLNNLGMAYKEMQQLNKALEMEHASLRIKEHTQDALGKANSLANIRNIYQQKGDFDMAVTYALKVLLALEDLDKPLEVISALDKVARNYFMLEQYGEALKYCQKAVQIDPQEYLEDYTGILKTMGNCYKALGDNELALKSFEDALEYESKGRETLKKNFNNDLTAKMQGQHEAKMKEQERVLLEKTNEALQQFSYVVSHDLKEPLRTVNSFLQALDKKAGQKLSADEKELLNFAVDGGKRMTSLIDEFLAFAKMSRNREHFSLVRLHEIVEAATRNLTLKIKESNGVITNVYADIELFGDAAQLIQLFQNLISNGLKFVKPGEQPNITIRARDKGDVLLIEIEDQGIGIPESSVGKVFEIMHRAHSRNDYSGHGIGLSTCRKIAENHNGRIWLESEEHVGTTFFIELPKLTI